MVKDREVILTHESRSVYLLLAISIRFTAMTVGEYKNQ